MTEKGGNRVYQIFEEALGLPPSERADFVAKVCGKDQSDLAAEVQSLLSYQGDARDFLGANRIDGESRAVTAVPGDHNPEEDRGVRIELKLAAEDANPVLPPQVGRYEILAKIGEGGMGSVYEAIQDAPRRRVAIKVVRQMIGAGNLLHRFRHEAAILGRLSHPGIAHIYEASTFDLGHGPQPFFAMEFVEGRPLDQFVERKRLALHDRLELLCLVCDAVHHAHLQGVIHRDLKPDNILVDANGQPKILDFGVARIIEPGVTGNTQLTVPGQVMGTLAYMSPEQLDPNRSEPDSGCDVYALGVLLYELLAGSLPLDVSHCTLLDAARRISEDEPLKLGAIHAELRGDVETIVGKALEKESRRRYESAAALATDIRRHLSDRPIMARPTTTLYRIGKFAKRNRGLVGGLVVAAVALVVGVVMTLKFAFDVHAQEVVAENQRRLANSETRRFRRLSVVVKLESALTAEAQLGPAWPEEIPEFETWSRTHGEPLRVELVRVRETIRQLESIAVPLTADQQRMDRESSPAFARFQGLQKKVAALERAQEVRSGKLIPEIPELPATTSTDCIVVARRVPPLVDALRKPAAHGREALGLALARRSISLAPPTHPQRHMILYNLAVAAFAVGLIEEARSAVQDGLAVAPDPRSYQQMQVEGVERWIKRAPKLLETTRVALEAERVESARRQNWKFEDESDAFLFSTLRKLEKRLVEFGSRTGKREDVSRRLAWARRIDELTLNHPRARVTWEEAAAALRAADGVVASSRYTARAVDLQPQTGLVPIGMNPVTKLWEFYHLRSAYDPLSGADPADLEIPTIQQDGGIEVGESTGIVFVLLPGGNYLMGGQAIQRSAPQYDPAARGERPHQVTVDAFFLARHELTQGQWMRLTNHETPSNYRAGQQNLAGGRVDLTHPVEQLSWQRCASVMENHGLRLPSEQEWEYGARAGSVSIWFPGDSPPDLDGYANLLDRTARAARVRWAGSPVPFADGHVIHAPVGSFRANAFGLYDTHGNVREWCGEYYLPNLNNRMSRGGGFADTAQGARSAGRYRTSKASLNHDLGFRAARSVR